MYAVRFRVVFKNFAQLNLVLTALTLVPLGVSIFIGDALLLQRNGVVVGLAAKDLDLPADAKIICYYRDGKFFMPMKR